ncbi:hypothetical protein EON81_20620 [bacterium]|nr:MAG: hypothetical protein EON81_20620 [bacterium]
MRRALQIAAMVSGLAIVGLFGLFKLLDLAFAPKPPFTIGMTAKAMGAALPATYTVIPTTTVSPRSLSPNALARWSGWLYEIPVDDGIELYEVRGGKIRDARLSSPSLTEWESLTRFVRRKGASADLRLAPRSSSALIELPEDAERLRTFTGILYVTTSKTTGWLAGWETTMRGGRIVACECRAVD